MRDFRNRSQTDLGPGESANAVQRSPGKQTLVEAACGAAVQRRADGQPAPQDDHVHAAAQAGLAQPASALPHVDRIQAAFGRHDVGGIQAHVGGAAAQASEAIGAQAYATGDHVAFRGAPDLHTAAHEVAHVVQQRAGVHLKGGVGEVGDPHEQHADAVADAVVQGKSAESLLDRYSGGAAAGSSAVQRRAMTAGELAGSLADGTDSIFDSKVSTGLKFKVSRQLAAPNWNTVIADYHAAIRPIGNAVAALGFIDQKYRFPNNIPTQKTWGQKKNAFFGGVRDELRLAPTLTLATEPDLPFWQGLADAAKSDPDGLRSNAHIGLIDPFVVAVEIKDSNDASKPAWRIVTQFANSGSGYIKKIYNGDQEFGGGIATSGQFNRAKDDDAAHTGTDYLYSSTHDQGGESFGDRIGSMASDKAKVGGNAKGLDAVTWLAAEGARFAPVAALGSAGSPESRYFIKPNPDNWTGYKFLTTSDLMQSWKDAFGKAYNVSAATMATVVAERGKDSTVETRPPAGVHYNLTTGARHDQG
jgi:uncharacterized protein DUF4157